MPFELSHSFNYVTGGIVDSRFCRNPLWFAIIITIIIMIIIPLTEGAIIWRGIFIFIGSVIFLFMYNASISRKITGAHEIEGAAAVLGDLSYLTNKEGLEIIPRMNGMDSDNILLDDESANDDVS